MNIPLSLDLRTLHAAYAESALSPEALIAEVYNRIRARGDDHVWITLRPEAEVVAEAAALRVRRAAGEGLPLFGVPFAVKDNLDVVGLPTTAACPAFAYAPAADAEVVRRLRAAGALVIGKTNLDQFATGLVGVRSPYGAPSSVFDNAFISGGSSSGSAVAVAAGLVSFALGTDTAGSGRVPAAFNNVVGWKPTKGLLSTRGLVPACRSLDCVSVFTLTCADAEAIAGIVAGFDPGDIFSRRKPVGEPSAAFAPTFRFGVPRPAQREFFGDAAAAALYEAAIARLIALGGVAVEIDFAPFADTAALLYSGPWVAERLAAITPFADEHPEALHPITAKIIGGARRFSAVDTFQAFYKLEALRRAADEWARMDVLLLPTTPTIYTHAELAAEPILLNTRLGTYTNFVNLLDLAAVAVPAGFRPDGLPLGVTVMAPAFADAALLALGARLHAALGGKVGGTSIELSSLAGLTGQPENGRDAREQDRCETPLPPPIPPSPSLAVPPPPPATAPAVIPLAVVGAHLAGQPLNSQLTTRGGVLLRAARTAADYQLFALANTTPPKPGLVRVPGFSAREAFHSAGHTGAFVVSVGIEVEVWGLSPAAFGTFTAEVPAPLAIGNVVLDDGSTVKGFVCEPAALVGATDITAHGGWRAFLASRAK